MERVYRFPEIYHSPGMSEAVCSLSVMRRGTRDFPAVRLEYNTRLVVMLSRMESQSQSALEQELERTVAKHNFAAVVENTARTSNVMSLA